MMLFHPKAALAKIEKRRATPEAQKHENETGATQSSSINFKHGFALNGDPKTWTGKIVLLEEWRRLSEWDRHGPDGRFWHGKTQRWEIADD